MKPSKKTLIKLTRALHRDIGYFLTGITIVYAMSGIFLTHKDLFPSVATEKSSFDLPPALHGAELTLNLQEKLNGDTIINIIEKDKSIIFYIANGKGSYYAGSGLVTYETYKTRPFIRFLNQLHINTKKNWIPIADIFAVMLVFLALSGLVIVPGKKGFLKRGIWFMSAGFSVVLLFIWIK